MGSDSSASRLEMQLKAAGNRLSLPPSSINQLLDLLDKVECLLSVVGQAPSPSMQCALVPSMGALISDELLRHSDEDVRVSVASCLSEVTRITAPDAPYNDGIMKEIFKLYVMAFGKLSHVSGRCYSKAIHIVESTAEVKSCLLMLDLECDDLIFEMFQHFLRSIRSNHPHTLFSDMETIMTLVIEESEEISFELLSLLLSHVKKEIQIDSPIPWKLAEKVLTNCADILKPYIQEMVTSMSLDLDSYADVVASLCQDANPKELLGNLRRVKVQEKASQSAGLTLRKKSKRKGPHVKLQKRFGKTTAAAKTNVEKSHAHFEEVIKKEDEVLRDSEGLGEPSFIRRSHKHCNSDKTTSRKHSGKGSGDKKSVSPATISGKGESLHNEASIKKRKRRRTLTIEENSTAASNCKEYGEELVGQKIKVWWPLDHMFYEGAVSSFDPSEKKHKVLYADGDEEVLSLSGEKWELLVDVSPSQKRESHLPNSAALSSKYSKMIEKRKAESSVKESNVSSLPKGIKNHHLFPSRVGGTSALVSKNEAANHDIAHRETEDSTVGQPSDADKPKDDTTETVDLDGEQKATEKHNMIAKFKQDSESLVAKEHILSQEQPNVSVDLENVIAPESANMPEESETKSAKKRRRLVKAQEFVSQL